MADTKEIDAWRGGSVFISRWGCAADAWAIWQYLKQGQSMWDTHGEAGDLKKLPRQVVEHGLALKTWTKHGKLFGVTDGP